MSSLVTAHTVVRLLKQIFGEQDEEVDLTHFVWILFEQLLNEQLTQLCMANKFQDLFKSTDEDVIRENLRVALEVLRDAHMYELYGSDSVPEHAVAQLGAAEIRHCIIYDLLQYDKDNKRTSKHDLYKKIAIVLSNVAHWAVPVSYGGFISNVLEPRRPMYLEINKPSNMRDLDKVVYSRSR